MNHPSKIIAPVLVIALSFIALVGCSGADNPLDGTRWKLDVWTLSSMSPREFPITAEFDSGRISGSSGVNTYSGPYTLGPDDAFSVGSLTSTEIAGSEQGMRAEAAYLTLLGQAKSFEVADAKLTLFDEFGNESLSFGPAGE